MVIVVGEAWRPQPEDCPRCSHELVWGVDHDGAEWAACEACSAYYDAAALRGDRRG